MKEEIRGMVCDTPTGAPIQRALVELINERNKKEAPVRILTGEHGRFRHEVECATDWKVSACAFGVRCDARPASADCGEMVLRLDVSSNFKPKIYSITECGDPKECGYPLAGRSYQLRFERSNLIHSIEIAGRGFEASPLGTGGFDHQIQALGAGTLEIESVLQGQDWPDGLGRGPAVSVTTGFPFGQAPPQQVSRVALQRSSVRPTQEENLWTLVRANSRAIGFNAYRDFINRVLCGNGVPADNFPTIATDGRRFQREQGELISTFGVGVHDLLRTATELFLLLNCRVATRRTLSGEEFTEESSRRQFPTPNDLGDLARRFLGNNAYLQHVVETTFEGLPPGGPFCDFVRHRTEPALIELIWSYWHEEGMLVQSVNALARRFQNLRAPGGHDALAHFELDPLRPLNNVLWGYVQEEHRRLTIPRRALEYSHHYGFTLFGKANAAARAADPRSKFVESFHNLLHKCAQFFKEDNDTTVIADGYPLLNALREIHLLLAQGAHNQFGDLPWTARVEMLMQQWIMARGETRDFLQSRLMVPYTEAWMPQVDTMKTVQGWSDVTVSHFRDLGVYGEQILLSIRYGNWVDLHDEDVAKNWARYFRPEIQSYLHSYRAVAGIDLTNPDTVDYTIPAVHLQRRLAEQARVR